MLSDRFHWLLWFIFFGTTYGLIHYELNELNLSYYNTTLNKQLSLTNKNKDNLLLPFNRTRIPGSENSQFIQNFIQNFYNDTLNNDWDLEIDNFIQNGYNFTNIVYTLNTNVDEFIVVGAHYDSKLTPKGFIGGMDSAVPCAILMYASQFIDEIYSQETLNMDNEIGLKVIFFDGEEAFDKWSPADSLYGSRHLAAQWEANGTNKQISTFVLLDLIGSKGNHSMPSYYRKGQKQYRLLNDIEDAYLETSYGKDTHGHKELDKTDRRYVDMNQLIIDDDHAPFWRQGVPILHLIPNPFPSSWHTLADDFDNLDQGNINKWAILMCEFLYSNLQTSA